MSEREASASDMELLASRICYEWHQGERCREADGEATTLTRATRAEVSTAVPVATLLDCGRLMDPGNYRSVEGIAGQPFMNAVIALKSMDEGEPRLAMGYALDAGVWRPHGWLVDEDGIYDPTGHRDGYWGFVLPEDATQQLIDRTF